MDWWPRQTPKDGNGLLGVLAKLADDIAADAGFVRRAGAGGNANALRGELADFVDAHGIIANHLHFRTQARRSTARGCR